MLAGAGAANYSATERDFPAMGANILISVALGAVALALFLGLANMMRDGSANTSQSLMRWRVGLQFLAILVIMGALWLRS